MRIKTTRQINARALDGREFAADEGSVKEIDDDDAVMVGLARSLIMSGQAQHYGDVGSVHEEPPMIDMADAVDQAPDEDDTGHGLEQLPDEDDLDPEDDER